MLERLQSLELRVEGLGIWAALLLAVALWLWRRRSPPVSPRLLGYEAAALSWLLIACIGVALGLVSGAHRAMSALDAAMDAPIGWTDQLIAWLPAPAGWLAVLSVCLVWLLRWKAADALSVENRERADGRLSFFAAGPGTLCVVTAAQVAAVVWICYMAPAADWQAGGRPLTARERQRGSDLPAQGIYLTNGTPLRERDGPAADMPVVARPGVLLWDRDGDPAGGHVFADPLLHPQQHWNVPIPEGAAMELRYFELTDARDLRGRELRVDIPTFGAGPWLVEVQFIAQEPRVIVYGRTLETTWGGASQRVHRVLAAQSPRGTYDVYDPDGPGLP